MNRRFWSLLLALLCCFCTVCADAESGPGLSGLEVTDLDPFSPETEEVFPPEEYEFSGKRVSAHYESDTVIYTIESFTLDSIPCLLTKIWVRPVPADQDLGPGSGTPDPEGKRPLG